MKLTSLIVLGLTVLVVTPADAQTKTKVRRFAYVIGANDGGSDRVKLRYAGTDADKVTRLLRDLGGVSSGDIVTTTSSKLASIKNGFSTLRSRLQAARKPGIRVELILYYSGHSDESGLLVGGEKYSYKDLRAHLKGMPADVNIAILDSCASGAFTRTKGGSREPAFLIDESSQVKGYAFISSSSADEVAQESDRITSSFFTHYLISGLRGGADSNRDGRVTLNEAYQFAFAETVARTESTVAGVQHPGYNMHLVGTGDVVMTDLRATNASLVVNANVTGRMFIRDHKGTLVIELNKPAGRPVVLGLGPGRYNVTLKKGKKLLRASVQLSSGRSTGLAAAAFTEGTPELTTARGDVAAETEVYVREPFRVSFLPNVSTGGGHRQKTQLNFSLNLLAGRGDSLRGLEVGGLVNVMSDNTHGAQVAGLVNVVGGSSRGLVVGGLANVVGDNHRGLAVAGLTNVLGSGVGSVAVGGLGNYVEGSARGLQFGGVFNYTRGHVEGTQIAGVVNSAGSVRGAQIGVVNVAGKVDGVQIGVINVADKSDVSIGLLNAARDGYHSLEVWTSATTPVHVGAKLGSRKVYTILTAASDDENYLFGAGLGMHRDRGDYYIDVDALGYGVFDHQLNDAEDDILAKLRFMVGFPINRDFNLFGGIAVTGGIAFDGKEGTNMSYFAARRIQSDDVVYRLSPGLFAGVSYQ